MLKWNEIDARHLGVAGLSQHQKVEMFPTDHPTIVLLVRLTILEPASNCIISDSTLLRVTAVCFLRIEEIGTPVRDPNTHDTPLQVDLESCKSPAKGAS